MTPTPVIHAPFSAPYRTESAGSCPGQTRTFQFYRWLPFGLDATDPNNPFPDRTAANDTYNCANANPYFWGWQPLFDLIAAVAAAAQQNQLTIADYDIDNELDVANFTVLGRLIFDNKHDRFGNTGGTTDVLGQIRSILAPYTSRVTYSTAIIRPIVAGYECPSPGSPYGDSAMILAESALMGALAGPAGGFGIPNGQQTHKLVCASGPAGILPTLPMSYSEPTVTNVHSHVCVEQNDGTDHTTGACCSPGMAGCLNSDATSTATALYNGVWSFLQRVSGRTANYVVFGETNHNQDLQPLLPAACKGTTYKVNATQNVNGFVVSTLSQNDRANTVFRVWNNEIDAPRCYVRPNVPSTVNPPYDPTTP